MKALQKESAIVDSIVSKIESIPNFTTELRYDIELTLYIANIVETELHKKTPEQKKEIIMRIIHRIIPLQTGDDVILKRHLDFLTEKKMIIPVSTFRYVFKSIGKWIVKKFN
jgi:hypothetical protein